MADSSGLLELRATSVANLIDPDHGEGWITFVWADATYGNEQLEITADGHCSRAMPWYSGSGLRDLDLHRRHLNVTFTPELAQQLRLREAIRIHFLLDDSEYEKLRLAVDAIGMS